MSKVDIKRKKTFKSTWLESQEFKGWLSPVSYDDCKCKCIPCGIILKSGKSELLKHRDTKKHQLAVKQIKDTPSMTMYKPMDCHRKKVKYAEIKLASFCAEHNVALHTVDHLVPLIKDIFDDSKIAKDIALCRRKCTHIIKNVISTVETEKVLEIIKQNIFSILIDESTDISSCKNFCILVRYCDDNFKINTRLLGLLEMNASDYSAKTLFDAFKELFQKVDVPIKNISGLATDNASVMLGKNNSFSSHHKQEVPHAVIFPCICYSSALAANAACDQIPKECEKLMEQISSYFSQSAKASAILLEMQEYFNTEKQKLIKPSRTRWLSIQNCLTRILESWTSVEYLFLLQSIETKSEKAKNILNLMSNPKNKGYFYFLKYALEYFNKFNALFQSENMLCHILASESKKNHHFARTKFYKTRKFIKH